MQAVRVHGRDDVRLDEVAKPEVGPRDVLVRVNTCGLCGSDLGYIRVGGVAAPAVEPFGIGHEPAGTVEDVGAEVRDVKRGARIVVNPIGDGNAIGAGAPEGAFAPYLLVRNATLGGSILPLPDHVAFETAALAEPLAVALHAARRGEVKPGEKVAIFGAGPIGLGVLMFLRRFGIEDVAVVDRSHGRLERARRLGATSLIDASREDPAEALGRIHGTAELFGWPTVGTEVFFEVAGAPAVLPAIITMAPFHARAVVVAVHHEPVPLDLKMMLGKEMTVTTAMAYPDEFPEVLAVLAEPDFDPSPLISHRFPLARFAEAVAVARDRETSAKVLVSCDA